MSVHESLGCHHYPGRKMRDIGQIHSSAFGPLPAGFMGRLITQWFVFLYVCQHFPPNLNLSLISVVSVEFFYSFFFLSFFGLINHEDPQKHNYASMHWGSQNRRLFTIKTWPDLGTVWDGTLGTLLWNLPFISGLLPCRTLTKYITQFKIPT